jgi:hypothetical protein
LAELTCFINDRAFEACFDSILGAAEPEHVSLEVQPAVSALAVRRWFDELLPLDANKVSGLETTMMRSQLLYERQLAHMKGLREPLGRTAPTRARERIERVGREPVLGALRAEVAHEQLDLAVHGAPLTCRSARASWSTSTTSTASSRSSACL